MKLDRMCEVYFKTILYCGCIILSFSLQKMFSQNEETMDMINNLSISQLPSNRTINKIDSLASCYINGGTINEEELSPRQLRVSKIARRCMNENNRINFFRKYVSFLLIAIGLGGWFIIFTIKSKTLRDFKWCAINYIIFALCPFYYTLLMYKTDGLYYLSHLDIFVCIFLSMIFVALSYSLIKAYYLFNRDGNKDNNRKMLKAKLNRSCLKK